jgi:hypothetical protein
MTLAPGLHPAHRFRPTEVIAVAVLPQPPMLAGGLAGLLTTRLGTISLPVGCPRIGKKKLGATKAFTPGLRAAHEEPTLRGTQRRRKRKRTQPRRSSPKKEEEIQSELVEENAPEENGFSNRLLQPSFIPPLTNSG